MAHTTQHTVMNTEMQECIGSCQRCQASCVMTATHCLEMGGKHASPEHIRLLQDCAQICATSADFMLRGSPIHGRTCAVCAEVCRLCAESCERMADGDAMTQQCADECRRCAESCDRMARAA